MTATPTTRPNPDERADTMKTYRVTHFADTPDGRRPPRGAADADWRQTIVEAPHIADAFRAVTMGWPEGGEARTIASVEEVYDKEPLADEEIERRITDHGLGYDAFDPTDFDDDDGYDSTGFAEMCRDVVTRLRDTDVVPGLDISLLYDGGCLDDVAMLEVFDNAIRQYRSMAVDLKDLTSDRDATGWGAVMAVAVQITDLAQELM